MPVFSIGGIDIVTRAAAGMMVLGFLPVVPMTIISAMFMAVVSVLTPGSRPARRHDGEVFSRWLAV